MADTNVYQDLLTMINRTDPHVIGLPNTPAMLKVLSQQLTPEEAGLALQVGTAGGTLSQLSARTGIAPAALKERLETMATRGAMWIDPDKDDPVYRVIGSCAPGFVETGGWGGVRFPHDAELIKNLHQVLRDWARDTLVPLGFPYAPVFAHPEHLPDDATPAENLFEKLKGQDFIAVSKCPCRLSHQMAEPGHHCHHLLDACIHYGDVAKWTVKYGMARRITSDEAIGILKKSHEEGLVHSIDIDGCICNCCTDCCPNFIAIREFKSKTFVPSPFTPLVDAGSCSACAACVDACPLGAISLGDVAEVDRDSCVGCAVCVPSCAVGAIRMVRR